MCRRIHILVLLLALSMPITARAQSSGFASTSPCMVSTPLVTVSAGAQSVGAGATVQYDITVTNRDSLGCRPTTFHVRGGVEEGWPVEVEPSLLPIAAGATAQATLRITSLASAAPRTYYVWTNVSDPATVAHNGSAAGAYIVMPGCVVMPPTMAVVPVMESGAPGSTFVYDVTVTNHDAAACPPTTFLVLPDLTDEWKPAVSPSSVVLQSGQSQTVRIALTSPRGLAPAPYSLYARVTDGRNIRHAASAELSYAVTAVATPPRPPSRLVAIARPELKQIQLRWAGSESDAGYRITRNGAAAGVTSSTSWTDVAWRSGGAVTYSVVAIDFSGRASAPSNVITIKMSTSK